MVLVFSAPNVVAVDSPEVRTLITGEEKRQGEADRFFLQNHARDEERQRIEDLIRHPGQMLPGHKEFVEAMAKAPAIALPQKDAWQSASDF